MKKAREKKEAKKADELNKRTQDELTQEVATSRVKETKEIEGNHKHVMKKVNNTVKKASSNSSQAKSGTEKSNKERKSRNKPSDKSDKSSKKLPTALRSSPETVTRKKKKATPQGKRRFQRLVMCMVAITMVC